ncbi:multisubunit potassium/proton antiporter, PhaA subunit /multisubunit potassium/proton antiporter, PhaB subunit [Roseovarius nanhaiticus]|uniref:Multisubunit potassium/proton antiporter, PhaA subunit /multisubunit potassium/proton antiporter, PhaB subunit n=1 Tax=Roseovarius nanhaiticus TaxID=573024 RepID=A0A1N7FGS2_9RHOB|nr:monovalent cation/H+ antiporter subunit A [Roseovarius nanhaiticus]SEK55003.1 multisubunit potassium/proton antiporter, PhaA subunit /multisubunit potassium/proton antiporter, PhaB subunit [Roseovarius nanhaiticus]SIR99426.1 multisubunit potassium/proton antiporter, PhaA subunit /multisubunit potassium/proton antiporter, PhaB subunit [Roseovarius nanhaiticus]
MSLFLVVALPFLGALLPGLMNSAGRQACAGVTFTVSLAAFIGLLTNAPAVLNGEVVMAGFNWLPAIGLNMTLMLDPLGFFFACLILGIGLLIIAYARFYLSRDDNMGEFFTYLLLFQGAMVGIVLSDNILLLLIFWELTSLSSFLLIGYWKHLPEGRQGARMALTVTGMGGLAMIAGMLILGQIAGSYDLSVILQNRELIQSSPLYVPALILILLGCFTKSAQFPFHFWLPHAMAAPTPVSAYLHSATMVKAGIFLMARMWPVLSGTPEWFVIVTTAGLITMVLGAVIALFKHDLKALLAFSTVSHLGLITMLLGTGTAFGAMAAVFHILNHASFKAALFMSAGIIDHETHTRDIRRLGGLRHLMPITFVIATLASLSMAGIPLLNGFLSKEMMLEEAYHTTLFGTPWLVPALAVLGSLFSAAYCFRLIGHTFLGPKRDDYPAKPHDPGAGMWLPPALLMIPVVVIGIAPFVAEPFVKLVTSAVLGDAAEVPKAYFKIWHGLVPALYMSIAAVVGGLIVLALFNPLLRGWDAAPRPEAKAIFDRLITGTVAVARGLIAPLHDGSFSRYAAIMAATIIAAGLHAWTTGTIGPADYGMAPLNTIAVAGWLMLVAATLGLVFLHHNRLLALILIGIVGLMVSIAFVHFSAPDLALTQFTVEVVTIILLLLALNFLPNRTPSESSVLRRVRDGAIAIAGGLATMALSWHYLLRDPVAAPISEFHLANSYKGGGGTNVVNVILVDFRGFDTFGEIIVLGIAALLIYALTEALLWGPARAKLLNRKPDQPRAGDIHPLMMVVLTRVAMPVVLMIGFYIFLRGHNEPGGGFIAGLIVSIAVVMQYMASGFGWTSARLRYPYHGIIGTGVLIAGLTGVGSWFFGKPFLTSDFTYVRIPPFEKFELATAALFDLGVFLAVVGAVMLSLESFSRLARRAHSEDSEHAMDIDPSREPEASAKEV